MRPENTIEVEEIEPEDSGRRHLVWIGAGAALVIALLALLPTAVNSPPSEAAPATLTLPAIAGERYEISTPIAVAAAFVDAYGTFDTERAESFLADDADVSRLEGGQSKWRLGNEWLQVVNFQLELASCATLDSSAPGEWVRCWYEFHALGSEEIGHAPFDGWFDVSIADGTIVAAWQTWPTGPFVEKVWDPFARWVAQTHPDDAEIMYTNIAWVWQRTSEESIALWELRSREYAELGASGDAYELRARAICRAATARLQEAWKASQDELIEADYDERQEWTKVAAPIMEDALGELREVAPPEAVRARFESDYALLEREDEWLRLVGAGVDAEPPPGGPAAHNIQTSLQECTSGG